MGLERESRYRDRLGDFVTYGVGGAGAVRMQSCLFHFPEARHEGARKVGGGRGLEIDSGDDCPTL